MEYTRCMGENQRGQKLIDFRRNNLPIWGIQCQRMDGSKGRIIKTILLERAARCNTLYNIVLKETRVVLLNEKE